MFEQRFLNAAVRKNVNGKGHTPLISLCVPLCHSPAYEPFVTATIDHTNLRMLASSFI